MASHTGKPPATHRNDILHRRNDEDAVPNQGADSDEAAAAWGRCAEVLHDNDKSRLQGWKEEIDMLLVFAGLFSAVLTAFNVQSYQLLQPDPTDITIALLMQISVQLNSFTVNPSFINSTYPGHPALQSTFVAPPYAVRINILWFASLICSLASASISILVKQWLNQYSYGLIGASHSRETARLRQYRYDSLVKWQVLGILRLLPLLLQVSLALFLLGLVDLLWNIHHAVAIVATVLIAVLLLFSTFTIILPSFSRDCFYKSPQALGFFLLVQQVLRMWRASCRVMSSVLESSWVALSLTDHINLYFYQVAISRWLYEASIRPTYYSWREQERESVRNEPSVLDWHILSACDALKMDDDFLENTIEPCFRTVAVEVVVPCYDDILRHRVDDLGDLRQTWTHNRSVKSVNAALSLTLCTLEKLNTGDQKYHEDQLCILRRLDTLWGSIGDYEVEYPATARLLDGLAEMFLSQFDRRCHEVCNIFPQITRNDLPLNSFIHALLAHVGEWSTFLDLCLAGLQVATSENLPSRDDEEVHNQIRQILSSLREYLETTESKDRAAYWFVRDMKRICRQILLVAQTFPGLVAAPGELATVLRRATEARVAELTDEHWELLREIYGIDRRMLWDDLVALAAMKDSSAQLEASGAFNSADWVFEFLLGSTWTDFEAAG
ncbi:hypothetical protein A0H81_13039 [Grifola frondosa]|uniref:DUF6535 domain-containing protein n=1 Tax=Grifola frondosa TaxID=5627 RepID=A0A1C7LQR8_GRIFR|nr:hypothetical protein A0H81_13039 [Grifola frondosa]